MSETKAEVKKETKAEVKKETKALVKGSPEWVAAKREAKKALDARLGTGRNVVVREDRR